MIENKAFLKKKNEEVIDKPPKQKIGFKIDSKEEITNMFEPAIELNSGLLAKEHPVLAKHYDDLNSALWNETVVGGRSTELRRNCELETQKIRKKIKEYEKNEGITREDHQRWANK